MTVEELRNIIKGMPSDVEVCFAGDADNPFDDYWLAVKAVRLTDVSHGDYDRLCFLSQS